MFFKKNLFIFRYSKSLRNFDNNAPAELNENSTPHISGLRVFIAAGERECAVWILKQLNVR
jgi:hypothetical protein